MTKSIEKVSKSERAYVHLILTSQGQERLSIVESAIDEYVGIEKYQSRSMQYQK